MSKKRMLPYAFCIVLALLWPFFLLPVSAGYSDGSQPLDTQQKVYDFAGLLNESEEQRMSETVTEFTGACGIDLVCVTTADAEGKSSMAYADDFFDYNGFGFGEEKSGFLLLVDMENRMIWLSGRGEAMRALSDWELTDITDAYAGYFTDGEYYLGMQKVVAQLQSAYLYVMQGATVQGRFFRSLSRSGFYLVAGLLLAGAVTAILYFSGHKTRAASEAKEYVNRDSVRIYFSDDRFLHRSVQRVAIPKDNGGGGGGGGHVSSSGASHSGGGSHF